MCQFIDPFSTGIWSDAGQGKLIIASDTDFCFNFSFM